MSFSRTCPTPLNVRLNLSGSGTCAIQSPAPLQYLSGPQRVEGVWFYCVLKRLGSNLVKIKIQQNNLLMSDIRLYYYQSFHQKFHNQFSTKRLKNHMHQRSASRYTTSNMNLNRIRRFRIDLGRQKAGDQSLVFPWTPSNRKGLNNSSASSRG